MGPRSHNILGSVPMVKKSISRHALAPWGMQPNTSLAANVPRSPWAFHCSCLFAAYYTTFPYTSSTRSTCSTRLSSSLFVYLVYFVVQFFASFAFFAATVTMSFYTANHLSTISQCPPLSGPTRRNIPSLFSFAIARATVLLSTPIISAISCVPTDGFARMAARIFCGVFCGVFCVLFREPFCALPPPYWLQPSVAK